MKMRKSIIVIAVVAMMVFGCAKSSKNKSNKRFIQEEKPVSVIVEEVAKRDLPEYISVTGRLEGIDDISLMSETNGKVIEIYKNLGDWIEKGEQLGRIDNEDIKNQVLQMEALLLSAEANLQTAEMQVLSSEELYKTESISEMEYIGAKSSYKAAQANYLGAEASLKIQQRQLANSTFTSPIAGYIANLDLEVGQMVGAGTHIASIVNIKKMIIKTGVSSKDIIKIKKNQIADLELEDLGKKYKGRVSGVGLKPINNSANYPIEIVLDNKDKEILPGMIVQGKILSKLNKQVIYISQDNIIERYDEKIVFVIKSDGKVEKRNLKLGKKLNEYVIVKSGLNEGEKLVVQGYDNLSETSKVIIK